MLCGTDLADDSQSQLAGYGWSCASRECANKGRRTFSPSAMPYVQHRGSSGPAPLQPCHVRCTAALAGRCFMRKAHLLQDWVEVQRPDLYQKLSYTSIEISPRLAQLQRERLAGHEARFFVQQRDARASWGKPTSGSCAIIMNEVLDNLPHDRLVLPCTTVQNAGHP